MKLLLDANVSWRLVSILKNHFEDCTHVDHIPELDFPAKDTKIWQYAKDNGFTIITHDNDFNDLTAAKGFPPKIVWLRRGDCKRRETADLLVGAKNEIEKLLKSDNCGLLEIF